LTGHYRTLLGVNLGLDFEVTGGSEVDRVDRVQGLVPHPTS